ncbi:ABC transporter substrate-binding protein [Phototrophicus methaneseepsis]|uniref:ABC transporter substrate-binding protein n=1 Tax=Phototrophicus methaneseepsis TaxID=2710758 RepID=A0A7S8IFA2_9CHLR|nr:ABC transporter substrate-binding protein [Phototrophicus methaneseepsis]QPC83367.1 ABC transporter substrate-binding protein [Phototrophicus methaneseepsis]
MLKRFLTVLALCIVVGGAVVAQDMTYNEAPSLAEKVAAGELPPVAERLPESPIVIEPVEQTGEYGGTWHMLDENNNLGFTLMTTGVEGFLKWNRDASGFRPNVLESYEWNDDATVLTAHFRQGIKWSDGEPLTANDYLFWWNDLVLNENIPVDPAGGTVVNGEMMTLEKVDDYTLTFTFAAPNPLFLEGHSRGPWNSAQSIVPAHYMKQFHPDYNADVTDTTELMNRYNTDTRLHYPDMPTIGPWMVTSYVADQVATLTRNPYYWKVDTEGNQLPYIENIQVEIASGAVSEQVALKAIAGELDMQVRDIALQDVPLILESAEAGGYHVIMWDRGDFAWPWLMLMYDLADDGLEDLMYTQAFRQALSVSINRDRINEVTALGLATPRQAAMNPQAEEFQSPEGQEIYEEWANQYIEYDPEQAMSLLDSIGVVDTDGDGFRERPDGTTLELTIDEFQDDTKVNQSLELIQLDWEAVGIRTHIGQMSWEEYGNANEAGEVEIFAWPSAAGWGLLSAPSVWAPVEGVEWGMGGMNIGQYYQTGGDEGVAPREGSMLERLQEAYSVAVSATTPEERNAALLDAYRIHVEEGPITIGTIGQHPSPVIVKNNFHNVPEIGLVGSWDLGYPGTADPEQFYIDQDE